MYYGIVQVVNGLLREFLDISAASVFFLFFHVM